MTEQQLAKQLIKKYATSNPFELAQNLSIIILYEDLGSINGYYNTAYRQKFIHINSELPEHKQRFTAAHELGHALLHPQSNTPFLRENTYFSVNRLEIAANRFAVHLLISDEDLAEYAHYTIDQLTSLFGFPRNLIELRLQEYLS